MDFEGDLFVSAAYEHQTRAFSADAAAQPKALAPPSPLASALASLARAIQNSPETSNPGLLAALEAATTAATTPHSSARVRAQPPRVEIGRAPATPVQTVAGGNAGGRAALFDPRDLSALAFDWDDDASSLGRDASGQSSVAAAPLTFVFRGRQDSDSSEPSQGASSIASSVASSTAAAARGNVDDAVVLTSRLSSTVVAGPPPPPGGMAAIVEADEEDEADDEDNDDEGEEAASAVESELDATRGRCAGGSPLGGVGVAGPTAVATAVLLVPRLHKSSGGLRSGGAAIPPVTAAAARATIGVSSRWLSGHDDDEGNGAGGNDDGDDDDDVGASPRSTGGACDATARPADEAPAPPFSPRTAYSRALAAAVAADAAATAAATAAAADASARGRRALDDEASAAWTLSAPTAALTPPSRDSPGLSDTVQGAPVTPWSAGVQRLAPGTSANIALPSPGSPARSVQMAPLIPRPATLDTPERMRSAAVTMRSLGPPLPLRPPAPVATPKAVPEAAVVSASADSAVAPSARAHRHPCWLLVAADHDSASLSSQPQSPLSVGVSSPQMRPAPCGLSHLTLFTREHMHAGLELWRNGEGVLLLPPQRTPGSWETTGSGSTVTRMSPQFSPTTPPRPQLHHVQLGPQPSQASAPYRSARAGLAVPRYVLTDRSRCYFEITISRPHPENEQAASPQAQSRLALRALVGLCARSAPLEGPCGALPPASIALSSTGHCVAGGLWQQLTPTPASVFAIGDTVGVTVDWLIGEDGPWITGATTVDAVEIAFTVNGIHVHKTGPLVVARGTELHPCVSLGGIVPTGGIVACGRFTGASLMHIRRADVGSGGEADKHRQAYAVFSLSGDLILPHAHGDNQLTDRTIGFT